MANVNRQITLAARPTGFPKESDFKLVESPIPSPGAGEILVQITYLSVDPYLRGLMNDVKYYMEPVRIGEVMYGGTVGRVIQSGNPDFPEGVIVEGRLGWQEYAVTSGKELRKVDPGLAPISTALGILGMPGLTAYFGLLDICNPEPGETVVISGAAGAVGSLAGQIAKILGCHVVGIAGSDAKVDYLLKELRFDAAFNYRATKDYFDKLRELCPHGVDVYFDNVGGAITDAVFGLLNVKSRISLCGQISQYNLEKPELGPRLLGTLILKQAKAEGFLVFQFADRYAEGLQQMTHWLREGRLKYREDIIEGIENAPRAFIGMLRGQNIGKQLVKVARD